MFSPVPSHLSLILKAKVGSEIASENRPVTHTGEALISTDASLANSDRFYVSKVMLEGFYLQKALHMRGYSVRDGLKAQTKRANIRDKKAILLIQ